MSPGAGERVIAEFGTGMVRTAVTGRSDGTVRWQRFPGPLRDGGFALPDAAFLAALARASGDDVRFAVPSVATPDEYRWEVSGSSSAAALLESGPGAATARLRRLAGGLGRQLRALHDQPPPPGPALPPPGYLVRLRDWLADGSGPGAAGDFHRRLREDLGPLRWGRLTELVHWVLHPGPGERRTVLHGWFSLGGVVAADDGARPAVCVLSGGDGALGRPEADVGCLLGELTEYGMAAERSGVGWPAVQTLRNQFLAHYGPGLDPEVLAAAVLARVAAHARDFAAYVGWDAQLDGYGPMLATLVDATAPV
ncbi:hypothetical protein ATKI12_1366 [Kitasatospora sp. Ki12]|uniref:hypothetical protein n=1 Tax=Kitasatospora xanthocidica TaxID=83382 RepID=UPI00167242CE|nr:hypothetical protein [Kitasatospora xanthocidica]GHF64498.1 hypothetical protein GCM10018790_47860 [Kitasatospora xanthocidica]